MSYQELKDEITEKSFMLHIQRKDNPCLFKVKG